MRLTICNYKLEKLLLMRLILERTFSTRDDFCFSVFKFSTVQNNLQNVYLLQSRKYDNFFLYSFKKVENIFTIKNFVIYEAEFWKQPPATACAFIHGRNHDISWSVQHISHWCPLIVSDSSSASKNILYQKIICSNRFHIYSTNRVILKQFITLLLMGSL